MRLYFLRHGQAGDGATWPGDDFERPLTSDGRTEMAAAAVGLHALGLQRAVVLSSPLVRARQTAEIAAQVLGTLVTEAPKLAPGCDLADLVEALRSYREADEALLVGHEPDFSTLIGTLITKKGAVARVEMKKGACCRVDVSGEWRQSGALAGQGTLKWLLTSPQLGHIGLGSHQNVSDDH